jgi:succinate dehydrogenase cytochrome b556 subunit
MQNKPSAKGGVWIWQALSGVLLILLLGLHMVAQHYVVEGGLRTFQDVVAYLQNPVILILEALFLLVVTYHAMVGVRAILFDLGLSDAARRTTTRVLTVLGLLILLWGGYLLFALTRA